MSQSTKRSAGLAFEDDAEHVSAKRKRARRKGGQKSREVSNNSHLKSSLSRSTADNQGNSEVAKLKDRITLPKNKRSKKSKHDAENVGKRQLDKIKSTKPPRRGPESWNLTAFRGGVFINHDPVLTKDGQHMILLTKQHVQVYSTTTSLLLRSVLVRENDTIAGCSGSASDPNLLLVATKKGVMYKIALASGEKLGQWRVEKGIKSIESISHTEPGDFCLVLRSTETDDDELVLISLQAGKQAQSSIAFRNIGLQSFAVTSPDASSIVVSGESVLHVGTRKPGDRVDFTWYVLSVQGSIYSFDVHTRKSAKHSKRPPSIDVVVGLENGAIFVYDSIVSKLSSKAQGGQNVDLTGRKMHWHRSYVRSVKWSRDGNYIISGGDETVLVIWQLDTNQQQFLPHLSTSILNIAVSAIGAHYALRLGDNSVMILSTADLLPSTNVTALSLPTNRGERIPMLLHPLRSNELLAAVPIRPSIKDSVQAVTHLQTYDIDASLQLNRQALTRNVTTAINISPHGQPVQEPNVGYLQISSDGNWLATVDTWSPDNSDMQAMYLDDEQVAKQKHTETLLRFWSWDAGDYSWDVMTRIDEPHSASKFCILGLAANPSITEFATMGEDGSVKIWRPRRRVRDGIQVRNKAGNPLYTWTCVQSLQVDKSQIDSPTRQPFGAIAYSGDGSVLVASWSQSQRHIHIIDPKSGALLMSLPHLINEGQVSLAVTGRFLLCLSNSFKVFDLITLQVTFSMAVKHNSGSFLAVDERSNAFAIGLNSQDWKEPAVISVFDIDKVDQGPTSDFEIPGQIRALLAGPSTRGFVVIDGDCGVRDLVPPGGVSATSSALIKVPDTVENENRKGLEGVFGQETLNSARGEGQQRLIEGGNTPRTLSELLSVPTTSAQLGVKELFDRVSRAMSRAAVRVGA